MLFSPKNNDSGSALLRENKDKSPMAMPGRHVQDADLLGAAPAPLLLSKGLLPLTIDSSQSDMISLHN
jgi:hypothetical protein